MPAYTRLDDGALKLSFIRDGEVTHTKVAADGYRAVWVAMQLCAVQDMLLPGDRLIVQADGEDVPSHILKHSWP